MSPTKRWETIMTKLSQLFCSSPCLKYSLLFLLCLKRMHNLSGFIFLFQHSTGCNTDICIFKYISFFFSFLIHSNLLICNKNQYYIKYWYLYKLFQNWITISTYNSYIILSSFMSPLESIFDNNTIINGFRLSRYRYMGEFIDSITIYYYLK